MTDIVPLRRNVRFQLLWLGSAVSQLGSELTRLAMPLLVLALTGSPGLAGVVAGARTVAFVAVQLPAGVWVDRWDRRRTLVTAQGCQTVVSVLLAALILTGRAQAWHFVALAVLDGLCAAFIGPAQATAIRGIVPPGQLHAAYAQEEARTHATGLIGPPLGGLLCREAGEAVAWLWRRKGLREVTAAVMVLNLLGGAFLIPLIVLVGERGGDAFVTGAVLAGLGVGGLVGSLLSGRISRLLPPGRLLPAVVAVLGGALAAALGGAAALVVLGGLLGLTAAAAVLSPELRGFTGEEPRG
ncbi:MFS transporter [Planomonospora parontospora]|uniref:MFS transporter n=1 Tax=Planomonospora parontospora TaxID=58119 RepID=UPI001670F0C4|nr:MFS transporter [Planomonospora parontospora]GGL32863.1 hypothetical protein GCM10014719_37600 [Planomonospora parontospora subsp. antibiotica]GII17016.1 hypothetical protein Ppa05_37420 [Planomonospora parontospora subsp. antibiotica]